MHNASVLRRFAIACLVVLPAGPPAAAGPAVLSELRAGVLGHDIRFLGNDEEEGLDINGEVLFVPLWSAGASGWWHDLLTPRPHLGVQVNTSGDTAQVYAGFTWTFRLLDRVWTGLSAGGALHDGELSETPGAKALGSRVLFRLGAEIGYDVTASISVSLYLDHESNAGLADENEGLNNAGVRVGWRF